MRVVVAGGGVGGAASAVALARAGAEVTVYEAHPDPAGPVGSFLSLAVNGLRGLATLGCLPQVQAAGFGVARQRMWSGHGKLLGDVPRGRRSGDPLHSVTLMRADLVSVLRAEAVRAGARIVTGQRLSEEDLRAAHAAGTDLIVGADGIWSAARRVLDPAAPEPTYAGLYSVSGIAAVSAVSAVSGRSGRSGVSGRSGRSGADLADEEPGAWNMIFGRHGAFIYLPAPGGTIWWSAQVAAPEPPADLSAIGPDQLAAVFRGERRAAAILDAARQVHAATLHHVLAPVRRWHGRDLVLVGDAAHPAGAGQGAAMAIEDAVELGKQLRDGATVADALTGYERTRRDRAGKMAKIAAANRDAKTAGPVAAPLRNLVMPLVFNRAYERATGWLYDYDPEGLRPEGEPTGLATSPKGLS
jgi:salicylate hydroxylase